MTQHDSDRKLQTEDLLGGPADTTHDDTTRDDVYRAGEDTREPADHAGVEPTGREGVDADYAERSGEVEADHGYADHSGSERGYADRAGGVEDEPVDAETVGAEQVHGGEYAAIPEQQQARESGVPAATTAEEPGAQLFADDEVERFRDQWQAIQTTFVDDPQDAVRSADHLVAEVMQALAATFTEHKRGLEEQWRDGTDAQTEDLRQALRRYRSFFNQLLHS
ncbi:hypothetical protein [Actinokineospora inagensis]|uniref:hypothetical protein n=1 Tax=Actinokineospora inagensis TaxID=103730 RepID=UPI0004230285|nr:hypothetical protein [Actinokineospora inagensis]